MHVIDTPVFEPGACLLTGAHEGPFIDTLIDIDDLPPHGRIYLAATTIADLAQHFGHAPPAAWQRQAETLAELRAERDQLARQVEALIEANKALVAAGYQPHESIEQPPAGSVQHVTDWVLAGDGTDEILARAQAALDAEQLEAEPRVTLVRGLEALVAEASATAEGVTA